MRIQEITSKNKEWNILIGIDVNEITSTYARLVKLLTVIIELKRYSKIQSVDTEIMEFMKLTERLLSLSYPDKTDPDIIELKNKIVKMQKHINSLKDQLTF
jgi:hypothetical protein